MSSCSRNLLAVRSRPPAISAPAEPATPHPAHTPHTHPPPLAAPAGGCRAAPAAAGGDGAGGAAGGAGHHRRRGAAPLLVAAVVGLLLLLLPGWARTLRLHPLCFPGGSHAPVFGCAWADASAARECPPRRSSYPHTHTRAHATPACRCSSSLCARRRRRSARRSPPSLPCWRRSCRRRRRRLRRPRPLPPPPAPAVRCWRRLGLLP